MKSEKAHRFNLRRQFQQTGKDCLDFSIDEE